MKMVSVLIIIAIMIIGSVVVGSRLYGPVQQKSDTLSEQKILDQNIPKPENFVQIKRDIQRGIFYSLENLSKDYYLQPDFYPSYKSNSNNSQHDYTRWGVHGYGAYPGEVSYNIKNFKKDQYVNVYTFVKASENIETFQGIKFDFDIIYGNKTKQNSSLFDIIIDPNTVMFTPTFPIRSEYTIGSRKYEWVYKLKVTIVAKVDIPTGIYEFKLNALPPDDNIQRLYYEDIQKINQKWYICPENKDIKCDNNIIELRKKVYVNGGQFQADKFFNIIINVGEYE